MEMYFKVGSVYKATGTKPGVAMRYVVCLGRQGRFVNLGFIDEACQVRTCDQFGLDREFVQLIARNGEIYNVSAAIDVDCETAKELIMLREAVKHG